MILFAWLAEPAPACGPPPGLYPEAPIGWTADARYFAFRGEAIGDNQESNLVVGVIDTRLDRIDVMPGARFEAWKSDHPLVPPNTGPRCGEASLIARAEDLAGYRFGAGIPTFTDGALPVSLGPELYVTLGAARAGAEWIHAEFAREGRGPVGVLVRAVWSPDCRWVAWTLDGYIPPRGGAIGPWQPDRSVIVAPVGPSVHVMAHRSAPEVVDPIVDALHRAGFAPHVGPKALKDRDTTVVYTSGAAKDVAVRLAKAIPGGATVEPLTWPTPADIVVAAGRSAAP